jgi:hypothetical protein
MATKQRWKAMSRKKRQKLAAEFYDGVGEP